MKVSWQTETCVFDDAIEFEKKIPNLYGCGLLQFRDVYFVVHFLATPGKYIFVWSTYIVKQVS